MKFYSFDFCEGPPPSSQISHTQRLILSYKCLALAWIVSCQLFLYYPRLPFASVLSPFLLYILLLILLQGRLSSWSLTSSSPCFSSSLVILLYSLPACLSYPCSCLLVVQIFIRTSGVLHRQSYHSLTELNDCCINKSHSLKVIFANKK